jgi:hypothetical protein
VHSHDARRRSPVRLTHKSTRRRNGAEKPSSLALPGRKKARRKAGEAGEGHQRTVVVTAPGDEPTDDTYEMQQMIDQVLLFCMLLHKHC